MMLFLLELCLLQWRPNKDKQLSGRIMRVKISCDYSTSRLTKNKTGCLVFKSSGQITCEYIAMFFLKCIWHIFLFAWLNLPNVLISVAIFFDCVKFHFWWAGLKIMDAQRTMFGLIEALTGQTFDLPVILTGQNWI